MSELVSGELQRYSWQQQAVTICIAVTVYSRMESRRANQCGGLSRVRFVCSWQHGRQVLTCCVYLSPHQFQQGAVGCKNKMPGAAAATAYGRVTLFGAGITASCMAWICISSCMTHEIQSSGLIPHTFSVQIAHAVCAFVLASAGTPSS